MNQNDELKHETATANGVKLHYVIGGTGEPVLLWHGFLGTWHTWRKVMPLLAQDYTVIAPDMRGYGDSEKPAGGASGGEGYDALTLTEDYRALVRGLGFEKISIIAFDMGAPPALVYAGEYPDEVRALVYLDEPVITQSNLNQALQFSPEGTQHGGLWWWQFALAPNIAETLVVGREREFLAWFHENYYFDKTQIERSAADETLRSFRGEEGVRGAFGVYRAIFETMRQTEKYEGFLSKIGVPVLGLGGEKSIGEKTKQMLESVASNVSGGAVERCGHFIPEERPDYLAAQADRFFREVQ